jgi:asparagine synthase (glutamine-hydrolysing)
LPGIAGVIGSGVAVDSESVVAQMIAIMRHEPTYVDRIQLVPSCQACVGWVAHPDSFASHASGSSGDGIELAFAGECFGVSGSTKASAYLLDAYRRVGPSFVGDLNGLFSGMLLDSKARRALLFVDRYASERIYYHQANGLLYFASEAKALLAVLPELRAFDPDGVADFLAFGSCRGTRTLFKGISRLAGASLWEFDSGEFATRQAYFDPSEWENLEPLAQDQFESAFVETARSVIPNYAQAESEIGFSITGGLDTRMILACLPGKVPNLACYTYGAASGDTLDVRIGREIANHLGYSHQTLRIDDRFVSEFQDYLDRSIFISDGCASALSAHELFFSEMARSIAPVRLTGNFGSEVLRSMSTLKPLSLADGLLGSEFVSRVDSSIASRKQGRPLTATVFDEIPSHLFGPLATARSQLTFRTPYLDNSLVKLAYQAPFSSRQTPAAALHLIACGHEKLGKTPTDLGYSCGRQMPLDAARRMFRKLSFKLDYWDKEGLPPRLAMLDSCRPLLQGSGILGLHKFLPYRRWFRVELVETVERATKRAAAGLQPWWNPRFATHIAADHASGRHNFLREINAILTLDTIERVLLDSPTRPATASDSWHGG